MNNAVNRYIDQHREEILRLGEELFCHPELGYKEFETKKILEKYLGENGLPTEAEYSVTGFSVSIGEGHPHIGLIAELDAIPTQGHPFADPETTAAHACGHSTQCTIMASLMAALKETGIPCGKVTLFFTPAEEFTDMEYRSTLVKEGAVKYRSGKQNMLAEHQFDDVDLVIHLHAMANPAYRFSVGSVLTGFVYKKITFLGKASHAAALPEKGINALHECTLFINAVNMLRETFRDQDVVRVHGIIQYGGNTVNSIPERVVYECYVRAADPEVIRTVNHQVNTAALHCAQALGGSCVIEDTPGYLPLHQNDALNEVVLEQMREITAESSILRGEISPAAGDVGDISVFKPLIQYGYSGFSGAIHGKDLKIADPEEVYIVQPKLVGGIVSKLLEHPERAMEIAASFKPSMTYPEYMAYLNGEDE